MNDQALTLRQMMADTTADRPEIGGRPVLVFGSGKGGVGKSVVAVLAAQALADGGARVLLVDGSQNLGHLHVMLGIAVDARLEHVLRGEAEPASLLRQVSERLWLLPGDSGAESLYALPAVDQARLHHRLAGLYDDYDVVVVDAGPGVETAVRLATMGGTRLVVVTVPEVAALTDAYALVKLVQAQLPTLPIDVLVNRAAGPEDAAQTAERLSRAAERFLGRDLNPIGGLDETPALRDAMRRPGALLSDPALEPLRAQVRTIVTEHLSRPEESAPALTSAGRPS